MSLNTVVHVTQKKRLSQAEDKILRILEMTTKDLDPSILSMNRITVKERNRHEANNDSFHRKTYLIYNGNVTRQR